MALGSKEYVTNWNQKGYQALGPVERQELLFEPCDECCNLDEFIELAEWAQEYGMGALGKLYDYCVEQDYDKFAQYIVEKM